MVIFLDGMLSAHGIDFMTHSFDAPARGAVTTGIPGPAFPYRPGRRAGPHQGRLTKLPGLGHVTIEVMRCA
jgi:hypothetical protein